MIRQLSAKLLVTPVVIFLTLASAAQAETILRRANDLSFGGSESLDPISANRFYEVNDLIYSRLIRQDVDGRPAPELAQTWTANATATEWTLTLQSGVTFHDGSAFDAADVKFTLERVKDPALESPVTDVLGFIAAVDVIDPLTARIRLSAPHAGLPLLLMDYRVRMLPQGAAAPYGVGTGPFKLDSFDPESTTILAANTAYWEGAPKLDRIEFTAIPDSEARNQAMLGGQIDYNGLTRDQEPLYAGNPDFTVQSYPAGGWFGIAFQSNQPPLDDPRIRKALRIAVDRVEMLALMTGEGNGIVSCDTPVMASDPFRANFDCPQDIAGAKALLAEAGYPDGIDIEVFTADLEPGMVQYAEVYQQQVAKAGIRVKLTVAPSDGYWDDIWLKKNAVTSWSQRPADQFLNEAYRSGAAWNESHFANAAYDTLLDQARATLDIDKARSLYVQAQEILFNEGGTLIAYQENGRRVMSSRVTGIAPQDEDYIRWHLVGMAD